MSISLSMGKRHDARRIFSLEVHREILHFQSAEAENSVSSDLLLFLIANILTGHAVAW